MQQEAEQATGHGQGVAALGVLGLVVLWEQGGDTKSGVLSAPDSQGHSGCALPWTAGPSFTCHMRRPRGYWDHSGTLGGGMDAI